MGWGGVGDWGGVVWLVWIYIRYIHASRHVSTCASRRCGPWARSRKDDVNTYLSIYIYLSISIYTYTYTMSIYMRLQRQAYRGGVGRGREVEDDVVPGPVLRHVQQHLS